MAAQIVLDMQMLRGLTPLWKGNWKALSVDPALCELQFEYDILHTAVKFEKYDKVLEKLMWIGDEPFQKKIRFHNAQWEMLAFEQLVKVFD